MYSYGRELLEWRLQKRAQASRSAAAMANFATGTRAALAAPPERAGEPARQAKRGSGPVGTTAAGGKPAGSKAMKGGFRSFAQNDHEVRKPINRSHQSRPACVSAQLMSLCY